MERKSSFCRIVGFLALIFVFLVTAGYSLAAEKQTGKTKMETLIFATGSEGSASYAGGAGISTVAQKVMPDKLRVLPKPTSGITVQLRMMEAGNVNFVNIMQDVFSDILKGEGSFSGKRALKNAQDLRALWPWSLSIYYGMVRAGLADKVKSLRDIEGRNVFMCPAGSGPYKLWTKVIGALGLTKKVNVKNIDYSMLPDSIKIKEVDVVLVYGRVNSVMSFLSQAEAMNPLTVIRPTSEELKTIGQKYPIWSKPYLYTFPVNMFSHDIGVGKDEKIMNICQYGYAACYKNSISEQAAYNLVKLVMENVDDLVAAAPTQFTSLKYMVKLKQVKDWFESLDTLGLKLHPGAEKYFKESGWIQ
jgi:TRAP transporter TAXI family solute receptor